MNLYITYTDVLFEFFPNSNWGINGDSTVYANIEWIDNNPIPQEALDDLIPQTTKDAACNQINDFRTNWIGGGFNYTGALFDTSATSMAAMTATMLTVTSGAALSPTFGWRDDINVFHPMTNVDFLAFYNAVTTWYNTVYSYSWAQKANVQACADALSANAYDFTQGWPRSWDDVSTILAAQGLSTVSPRVITSLAFRNRFTPAETSTITVAAYNALVATPPDATLQGFIDALSAATVINLDDPAVPAALSQLVTFGLLTSDRQTAILSDPLPNEMPIAPAQSIAGNIPSGGGATAAPSS